MKASIFTTSPQASKNTSNFYTAQPGNSSTFQRPTDVGCGWGTGMMPRAGARPQKQPPGEMMNKTAWPPMGACPLQFWNHTRDLMQDWTPMFYFVIWYFVMEMLTTAIVGFAQANAYIIFPSSVGIDPFIRASIIGAAVGVAVLSFGRYTGSYLTVWLSLWIYIRYWLFDSSEESQASEGGIVRRNIFWEFFKLIIMIIAQLVGYLVGLAVVGLIFTGPAITSNCAGPNPAALCAAGPTNVAGSFLPAPTSIATRRWQEVIGAIIIFGTYTIAEALYNYRSKNSDGRQHRLTDFHSLIRSSLIAGSYTFVHIAWGSRSGGQFNIFYWLVTAWYINDYTDAGTYIWPSLLGCLFVIIIEVLYYGGMWWYCRNYRKEGEYEKVAADHLQ